MTHFADLSPYSYGPNHDGSLNVGWLDGSNSFPTGPVPSSVVDAILRLVRHQPVNRMRGWHRCELCEDPPYPARMDVDGAPVTLGDAEIRVEASDGTTFAAPSLLAHYIDVHHYLPPRVFVEAVTREDGDQQ